VMSYYEVPADVLEDPDELSKWTQRSLTIAKKKRK
jgi:TfoX/Sxy family transcriptional regulator of competence genes